MSSSSAAFTRQKGIVHLVRAIQHLTPGIQVVLCAGAPDTPEIGAEMKAAVDQAQARHGNVVWIDRMVTNPEKIELYSHATAFCCPSIYEPFGIINLEAMACETAVVASAVGGIKEVVVPGETGLLVPLEQMTESPFEATDPERYARDLADAINTIMADPVRAAEMGKAGRKRAEELFSWSAIARQVHALYAELITGQVARSSAANPEPMNPALPPVRDQREIDASHLNLLAIFHFVLAGLSVLGSPFCWCITRSCTPSSRIPRLFKGQNTGAMPAELFAAFRWFYAIGALFFIGFGILNLVSGLCIRARKRRTFSLVVAGANCIQFPFGTALGIFTIIVLDARLGPASVRRVKVCQCSAKCADKCVSTV
jgi:hypothetical protein